MKLPAHRQAVDCNNNITRLQPRLETEQFGGGISVRCVRGGGGREPGQQHASLQCAVYYK